MADLPSGTEIYGTLAQSLDTKTSHLGDQVNMKVTSLFPQTALSATVQGATIHGHVTQVTAATPTKKAALHIAFDTIQLIDGRSYPFPAEIEAMSKKKKVNLAQAAGEILTGMLVGNMVAKTTTGGDAGGTVGAISGVVYASNMAVDFKIPADSTVKLKTMDSIPITEAHPQAH